MSWGASFYKAARSLAIETARSHWSEAMDCSKECRWHATILMVSKDGGSPFEPSYPSMIHQ